MTRSAYVKEINRETRDYARTLRLLGYRVYFYAHYVQIYPPVKSRFSYSESYRSSHYEVRLELAHDDESVEFTQSANQAAKLVISAGTQESAQ